MSDQPVFDARIHALPVPNWGLQVPNLTFWPEIQALGARLPPPWVEILRFANRLPIALCAALSGSPNAMEKELRSINAQQGLFVPPPSPLESDLPSLRAFRWISSYALKPTEAKPVDTLDTAFSTAPFQSLILYPALMAPQPTSSIFSPIFHWAAKHHIPVSLSLEASILFKRLSLTAFTHWFQEHPKTHFLIHVPGDTNLDSLLKTLTPYPNASLITGTLSTETLSEFLIHSGPERLIFGSNWPFSGVSLQESVARVQALQATKRTHANNIRSILWGNATRLFQGEI